MAATSQMGLLTTFQHHIDDMRNLAMCKICLKPLYEPFILACGHTYCYGCLRSWFSGLDSRRRKKNCPDCRAEVRFTPAPNYILRDLVHMFIGRAELLPEDETVEEHVAGKKVEADLLASDKEGKGLFQGVFFRSPIHHPLIALGPIRDYEDGVERCPMCAWEIEDGMCNHCGYDPEGIDNWSDDEENEMSLMDGEHSIASDDISEGSGYDSENDVPPHFYGARSVADDVDHSVGIGTDQYSSDTYYGTPTPYDEDGDDMESFITNNDEDEPDEVDEDDMDEAPVRYAPRPRTHLYRIPDDEEESSDEEEDETLNQGYNWHPESSDGEENEGHDQNGDNQDVLTNYDESDEESRSSTPIAIPIVPRRRHIVISDDEDEDENEGEAEDDDDDEGEEHNLTEGPEDDETHNDVRSHTEGRSHSEGGEDDGNSSSDSDEASLREELIYHRQIIENERKRRRSPDVWRAIARPRREDYAERQTSQYRAPYRRQNRPAQTPVNLSS